MNILDFCVSYIYQTTKKKVVKFLFLILLTCCTTTYSTNIYL